MAKGRRSASGVALRETETMKTIVTLSDTIKELSPKVLELLQVKPKFDKAVTDRDRLIGSSWGEWFSSNSDLLEIFPNEIGVEGSFLKALDGFNLSTVLNDQQELVHKLEFHFDESTDFPNVPNLKKITKDVIGGQGRSPSSLKVKKANYISWSGEKLPEPKYAPDSQFLSWLNLEGDASDQDAKVFRAIRNVWLTPVTSTMLSGQRNSNTGTEEEQTGSDPLVNTLGTGEARKRKIAPSSDPTLSSKKAKVLDRTNERPGNHTVQPGGSDQPADESQINLRPRSKSVGRSVEQLSTPRKQTRSVTSSSTGSGKRGRGNSKESTPGSQNNKSPRPHNSPAVSRSLFPPRQGSNNESNGVSQLPINTSACSSPAQSDHPIQEGTTSHSLTTPGSSHGKQPKKLSLKDSLQALLTKFDTFIDQQEKQQQQQQKQQQQQQKQIDEILNLLKKGDK